MSVVAVGGACGDGGGGREAAKRASVRRTLTPSGAETFMPPPPPDILRRWFWDWSSAGVGGALRANERERLCCRSTSKVGASLFRRLFLPLRRTRRARVLFSCLVAALASEVPAERGAPDFGSVRAESPKAAHEREGVLSLCARVGVETKTQCANRVRKWRRQRNASSSCEEIGR